jgi:NADH-quinone oxidoreductase subunit D
MSEPAPPSPPAPPPTGAPPPAGAPPAAPPPAAPAAPPGPLDLATLCTRVIAELPGMEGKVVVEGPALVVDRAVLLEVMRFLRDDDKTRLDFLSNLCAVDWLKPEPRLEVVYHLFSVAQRHGPLTVKCRTANRADDTRSPRWSRCGAYQEREASTSTGSIFTGHPDLRRILMWDGFEEFPMRKDYVAPDDYEWEPTPHDEVLRRRRARGFHRAAPPVDPRRVPHGRRARRRDVVAGSSRCSATCIATTRRSPSSTTYLGSMPYTDRLDYFCSLTNNWAYALAVEKLAGLQVPERAEYMRVITAELTRLLNHTCLAGFLLQDMGALGTPLMYAFREREKILDLFESLTGARMMCNYLRFGGCRCDSPPAGSNGRAPGRRRIPGSSTSSRRCSPATRSSSPAPRASACLPAELAINAGITGPMLRASGVNYDLRKVDRYGIYDASISRPARRPRRCLRPLHDARPRDARIASRSSSRPSSELPEGPDHRSQGEDCAASGPRPARPTGASRRRRASSVSTSSATAVRNPVPLPRPPAELHQPDRARRHVPRPHLADAVIILGSIDIVLGEVDR